jgi:hypothetical protein
MLHEIVIDLVCNKVAAMSEFDTFFTRPITAQINVERTRHSRCFDWDFLLYFVTSL